MDTGTEQSPIPLKKLFPAAGIERTGTYRYQGPIQAHGLLGSFLESVRREAEVQSGLKLKFKFTVGNGAATIGLYRDFLMRRNQVEWIEYVIDSHGAWYDTIANVWHLVKLVK